MRRTWLALALYPLLWSTAPAQRQKDHGTMVIVFGQEATLPIPTLARGKANQDVADLLFLRLMRVGPELVTAGDRGFVPELARSFTRRDSLTLAFELDPRARWHDGRPVTANDVVFAFGRGRDPAIDPSHALLLRNLASVTAEGSQRVVIRFSKVYGEQLYDAVWHIQPLPAHLLDTIPSDQIATSTYAAAPVGSGAYRWVRRDAGRQTVLAAMPDFFLGRPRIDRVVILLARDPEAQLNLILDGTADALENSSPTTTLPRLRVRPEYRLVPLPSFGVGYLLFNQRSYGDRSQPHPILADRGVRRALAMALDRAQLVRATLGDFGSVAEGPVAQLHWIRDPNGRATGYDPQAARRLLAERGWRDTDGDGTLDRNGQPLLLRLNFPGTSAVRNNMAVQIQEQYRRIGVRLELVRLDGPVWAERRGKGEFEIDFSQAVMDPSPAGLVQSWSCAGRGGSNVAQYCNPAVDSLIDRAMASRTGALPLWREAVRTINSDTPAVFLFTPVSGVIVHRRYADLNLRPEAIWSQLWRWRVTPGQQIPRDLTPP